MRQCSSHKNSMAACTSCICITFRAVSCTTQEVHGFRAATNDLLIPYRTGTHEVPECPECIRCTCELHCVLRVGFPQSPDASAVSDLDVPAVKMPRRWLPGYTMQSCWQMQTAKDRTPGRAMDGVSRLTRPKSGLSSPLRFGQTLQICCFGSSDISAC